MSEFETPAGGETPSVAQTTQTSAPASQGATPTAPVSSPGQTQSIPEGYVPSHRLREVSERARAIDAQYRQSTQDQAALQARYQEMERKFNALAGVTPPPDAEIQGVKDRFGQLYSGLPRLDEKADQILALLDRAGDLESQNQHYWQSYAMSTMDRLFTHASESIGSPLTEDAKRLLHSSFVGWVQSSPELTQRYSSDPSLVQDFWKAYTSSFIDPARRAATASIEGRVGGMQNLPRDTPGGAPRATPAPHAANLDERVNNAWAQYQSTKRG